jgi:rubredoxin-NAD+ reductase
MLSGCRADVYQKPMLSVACAQGKAPQDMVSSTGADCAAQLGLRLIPETWMVGLDTAQKRIRTTRGTFAYRDLVIATGAAPASLPLDAQSLTNIWRINHLNEYAAFRQRLTIKGSEPCDIVIIGAGLVGCELADDLASLGHRCTLLEAAVQPLMGLATPAKADELIDAYAKAGIRIHTGTRVSSVQRAGAGYMVHCSYGLISADLVIAATGLRTEGRVAQSAGLAFDNGYAVDAASMRTSDANVYALGDCASFSGKAYRFIEPIHRQAEVIAAQISGAPTQGFAVRPVPVRLKSRTLPMTFQMAA